MPLISLFATQLYSASLRETEGWSALNADLAAACLQIADDDSAGQTWCEDNGYDGYTSYASLNDLDARATAFADLKRLISEHADKFAQDCGMDLGGAALVMDSYWINILNPLAAHSGHIHPNSVLSGTYYVDIPEGAGALKLEDPRLAMMMAAPRPRKDAPDHLKRFFYLKPEPGLLALWESWLRHEVTPNQGEDLRISISFNFSLD